MLNLEANSLGITLAIIGLILIGVIGLLLRVVPRIRPPVEAVLLKSSPVDPDLHQEAVILLLPGGRISWLNSRARQVFNLLEQEVPNLERLSRHTRPSETFMGLCASEGQAQFAVDGRWVDGTSFWVQIGQQPFILLSLRYPEISAGRLLQETGISGQTLRTITELNQSITTSLDLKTTLLAILHSTEKLIRADILEVNIWDAVGKCLVPYRFIGVPGEARVLQETNQRYHAGEGLSGVLLETHTPLLVRDLAERQDISAASWQPLSGLRSYLGVPLMYENDLIGTLELGSLKSEAFTQTDMDLLVLLAPQAAIAIKNAILYKSEQRRAVELAGLAQLSQALGLYYDSRDLYSHLVQSIAPLLNVSILGFLIYNENKRSLEGQAPFLGLPPQFIQYYTQVIEPNSLAEQFLLSQEMLVSENAAEDPYWISIGFDHLAQPASLHETALVPLKTSGRLLGYLQASNHIDGRMPFDEEELHLLKIIANQAAPIIENAALIRQSRQRAQRAEALRQIASLASSTATLDEILKFSMQELVKLLKADIGLIFLINETGSELRMHQASAIGFQAEATRRAIRVAVDDPQFYFTVTGRKHILVSRKMSEEKALAPVYRALITLLDVQAAIIVPLVVRDRGVGELWLGSHSTEFFDRSDLLTVSTACGQLAGVVEQSFLVAQTDESLRRRLEQLIALTRISRELSTPLDVKYLLQIVFDETLRTSRADSGTIMLFDPESTNLTTLHVQYYVGDAPAAQLLPIERAVFEQAEVVAVADYAESDFKPGAPGIQSALVVPIAYQQRVAGIIHLRAETPGRFDQASVEITEALAVQVSLVLGNVLQYQDILRRGELLKRQVETLAGLLATSQVLRTGQSLEQSLQAIAVAIQQATPFQVVLISVYQPQEDQLQCVCGVGFTDDTWHELQAHHQPWHAVEALLRPEFSFSHSYFIPADKQPNIPAEVHIVKVLPSLEEKPVDAWDAADLLLAPLLDPNGMLLGLVNVDNPRDGHRPDRAAIEALEIFSGQAALAINIHHRLGDLNDKVDSLQSSLQRAEAAAQDSETSLPALLQKDLEQSIIIRQLDYQSRRIRDSLEIAVLVNRQGDSQAVLTTLGSELISRLDLDLALVAEATPSGPRLLNVIGTPPSGANPEALFGQRNPLRQAFRDGELVLVNNLDNETDLQSAPLLHSLEARSLICLPVVVEEKVAAAALLIGQKVMPPFTAEDRQIFLQLTRQVAITLQNLRLLTEARRRLQEVDLLLAFSRQLGSLNPASILNTLVESVLKAVPAAHTGMVALWDDRSRQLIPQSALGYSDNRSLMEIIYTVDSPVQGAPRDGSAATQPLPLQVFLAGQPVHIDEVNFARDYSLSAEDLLRYRRATGGRLPVSSLMVPIKAGEMNLGLLALDNFITTAAFTDEDEALTVSLTQQTALALENARLFLASEKRAMQLQALTNVAGTMTSSLQTNQLVASLLDQLKLVIPFDTATLWLRSGGQLTVAAASGFLDSEQRLGLSVAVEDSALLSEMIKTGQPLSVKDVRSDERFPSLIELDYRSWLGLPLIAKGEVIGVIALEKAEVDFYTTEHIQSATTFAGQSAIALENARLFEESQRRAAELDQRSQRLALLNRLSSELATSLDVDTILRSASQEMLGALNAAVVSALQVDADGRVFLRVEVPVFETNLPQDLPSAPIFERLRESLGIFSASDISIEPDLAPLEAFFSQRGTRSLLAVPLLSAGQLSGLLLLQANYPYRFTSPEIELALTIANQTAIAVQNARLFAETVRLTEDLEQRVNQRTAELVREHRNTEALLAVITELSTSLDIYQVLNRTLNVLEKAVEAEQSVIFVSRGGPLEVYFRTGSERPVTGSPWPVFVPEPEIANLVFKHRQSVLVEDLIRDGRWQVPPNSPQTCRSVLAAPLVLGEEVFGALLMLHSTPSSFDSRQVSLIEAAARQISVSLNNAELFNLIRDQAEKLGGLLREQQVEASRSRAILEAVADGVLVTDASNTITLFNASAERILNLRADQMTGQSLEQFPGLFGKSTRVWMAAIQSWISDPSSYQPGEVFSEQVSLDNGRVVEVDLAPVFLRSRFLGTVSIFHDITNEVRIDRLKSEFVANVSHELRTPMTSIKGYVDVMLMGAAGALNDQQTHFLQVVKSNTQRLNVLVNDLLDVSRIEAGRVTLNLSVFNMAEIALEVFDDIHRRSQEEKKPMEFSMEISPYLPWVQGDPEGIRQVLVNLVSNAYNYTPMNGKVVVSAHLVDTKIQVDVLDNGIGIKSEDQSRIFERFFRGEDPLVLATAGTGLGLAIVKNLVEMHHGQIWFTSRGEPGQGSVFSFTLPLQQPGV
jgi:PAS domain S-box-containing protein